MTAESITARTAAATERAGAWLLVAPTVAVAAWGGNHFTPLLLLYKQVEGYSSVEVDLFLAFYVLGLVPGLFLAGPFSDRHGRKKLMFVALLFSAIASVLLALGASSAPVLCLGRLLAGVSVAIAMVVGSSWIKELSGAPFEPRASAGAGARRASISLTIGFGVGAGVAGALAQWGPWPTLLPYGVQVVLVIGAAIVLLRAPETRPFDGRVRSLLGDLRIPPAARRRFYGVILPMAPWVFSTAALAYAVMPELIQHQVGSYTIAFATLLTVVSLGCGALVQPNTHRIATWTRGRQSLVAFVFAFAGVVLGAVDALILSPVLAIIVAALLGVGYGIMLVSGLTEVQRMAGPDDIAGITGIYYSLTYIGFLLPVILASLASVASYPILISIVAVICLACAIIVARNLRATSVG